MFQQARWRYLSAMGLSGLGAAGAVVGCQPGAVDPPHDPVSVGTSTPVNIPTVAPEVSAKGVVTSAPTTTSAPTATAVASASAPIAAPTYLDPCPKKPVPAPVATSPHPRFPACPGGSYCIAEPRSSGGAMADAPYGRCPAQSPAPVGEGTFGGRTPFVRFDPEQTKEQRACNKEACCYHWSIPCPGGRLLRDGAGEAEGTPLAARGDWRAALDAFDPGDLAPVVREALADRWAAEASFEHASIASFARASLELLALGAPPELLAGAQAAALDEIEHARLCYALASTHAGRDLGPAGLPAAALEILCTTFPTFVAATFRDACVGETVASLRAAEAADGAVSPVVAGVLHRIAADESRHAELAWTTLAWALRRGGAEAARALRAEVEALASEVTDATDVLDARDALDPSVVFDARGALDPSAIFDARDAFDLTAHGFLRAREDAALRLRAVREVVLPCAEALLALHCPEVVSMPSAIASSAVP